MRTRIFYKIDLEGQIKESQGNNSRIPTKPKRNRRKLMYASNYLVKRLNSLLKSVR